VSEDLASQSEPTPIKRLLHPSWWWRRKMYLLGLGGSRGLVGEL